MLKRVCDICGLVAEESLDPVVQIRVTSHGRLTDSSPLDLCDTCRTFLLDIAANRLVSDGYRYEMRRFLKERSDK